MTEHPPLVVNNNTDSRLYDAVRGDQIAGTISYELSGNRVILVHTYVPPEFRRQGIATELVKGALDDIRDQGKLVTAYCGFVADYLDGNPGYQDIIDHDHPVPHRHR